MQQSQEMAFLQLSAVVVLTSLDGYILLLKRAAGDLKQGWCLPGGKADFKESPAKAAKRELWEETGLSMFLEEAGQYTSRYKSRKFEGERETLVTVFRKQLSSSHRTYLVKVSKEHEAYQWFTLDEIKEMQQNGELAGKTYQAIEIAGKQ